jgi:putative heme iron utilization protein
MPYGDDGLGRPLLLISGLAVHTRNLEADPRASLLVAEPGPAGDVLAAERVTVLGTARRLAAPEVQDARTLYLARHPEATAWVEFGDFALWRVEVDEVYVVGGFGVMGWVTPEVYAAAKT